ncbi:Peptidase M28 [Thermoplasmatales archaeon SCGC AB-540-F20]|nr:Peptidase M28 [Thermoplasmatales archaeon SCGC AB-540-F20]
MMKKNLLSVVVFMLLIVTFLPISSHAIEFNNISNYNQDYIDQPNDHDPPIPGHMSLPYPDFNEIDTSQKKSAPPKIFSQSTSDNVIDMIQEMNESMILGYLENLTYFGPRVTGTPACQAAGDYIYNEFQSMGLEIRYHNWSYSGYSDRNIEATLPGTNETSDEIYVVCGHYDSVSGSPGADDDGSGVVAVMSAAFIMKEYAFNHTIRFVTFSGEEQGLLGSHEYAEEAFANGDNIIGVLNADMIGFAVTTDHGNNIKVYENDASEWLTDFTDDVSEQYDEYIQLNVIPSGYTWGSDHYSFWQVGYDAIFYHEYEFNYYYHSPQDTIENMNITYDAKCSKLILATLAELAQQCDISNPPDVPIITGPTTGMTWVEYEYNVVTTDPDGDDIYYYIDWGDDTNSGWIGPYKSGEEATAIHKWISAGDYEIRARAKDVYYVVSDWSDLFPITILEGPNLDIQNINGGLFEVNTVIKNTGGVEATDVNWKITLDGGAFIGKETSGTETIPAGEDITVTSKILLGFGSTIATVEAWMPDGPSDTREQSGFVLLFFIKVNPGDGT